MSDEGARAPIAPNGADDEDAADVQRVLSGNVDAFGGIVGRWQRRLVTLAWRFCRDRTLAEDMAQDAFLRAFRALHTFRAEAAFGTWLTAIAINTYRSWLRDRAPIPVNIDLARVRAGCADCLVTLQEEERASAVRQLTLALPPRYRDVIVLYYFNEMDLADTARALGVPEGTVKARLHRGRALLKRRSAALWSQPGVAREGKPRG